MLDFAWLLVDCCGLHGGAPVWACARVCEVLARRMARGMPGMFECRELSLCALCTLRVGVARAAPPCGVCLCV